ncbi:FMRFamide-activated amiloride-sensitive sodium channel-like [Littorina saxatilis]|uniref:FMRFamide-activated amiloride-sensitive sodium channel-like n=1 Tax=Littorina saxatilis TaxID=31220 RepID=UPI0038B639D8
MSGLTSEDQPDIIFPREPANGQAEGEGEAVSLPAEKARRRRQVFEGGFLSDREEEEEEEGGFGDLLHTGQVRVHVYFEDLRCDVTETVESNDWVQVMADIGGITSLWLGLSVLGVLEVVHLLVQLLLLGCGSMCGGGTRLTPVKPMAPASTFA